ncbi:helix-turn-helix transcriptional regulator [Bacillus cytotoxicus]|uniref:Transcriptional regulator, XRE family n=2 Tax=Bacillus cytotoxicus TaxID=580165 RepID=A0AAX2CK59_9BACI|nr:MULTISPECIES: helix-turn-helix domain-containing protein [Bacillus cereus group]ABS22813.1 transcriptional regulator, XRE family [Bacillus cytotoxicus NVH 391-98]MDH2866738.1 helix-turn-helix domain-containing protein [Bacillus cytotoxicus]MDH2884465.1 helix-turn-helix domain-containing protein [Bacillus cytotoxicus]QTR69926.1 helix-turn-helix domain-containing protein [Bacillus cytotoxicus]QTR81471.1 helix-turn-helix domain-containing protein [Bacillus cytotoxicus]
MNCKLKVILAERMIKQSALAKRAGITDQTLSMIVRGKSEPTLRVAMRIAKALDMKVEDIWNEEKE